MNNEQKLAEQFAEKVLFGMRLAVQRLVEKRAAQNQSLVVLVDGKPCEVPAKELLMKRHNKA